VTRALRDSNRFGDARPDGSHDDGMWRSTVAGNLIVLGVKP
jgi:hypothetical protein